MIDEEIEKIEEELYDKIGFPISLVHITNKKTYRKIWRIICNTNMV